MWINIITGHSTYMHIGVVVMMHSTRLTIQFCLFGAVCLGVFVHVMMQRGVVVCICVSVM